MILISRHSVDFIFIFIHRNGREKYNNTKPIKSEGKIKANNSTDQDLHTFTDTIYDIF